MGVSNTLMVVGRVPASEDKGHHAGLVTIIEDEREWPAQPSGPVLAPRVVVTRWRSLDQRTLEVSAETRSDGQMISIVMRNANVRLSVSGRVVHDGAVLPGVVQVTEPAASVRCVFRGPYDILHLHVPNSVIAELGRDISGRKAATLRSEGVLTQDPIAERLAHALLAADDVGTRLGQLYADYISKAIVTRLLTAAPRPPTSNRRRVSELPSWRVRRVMDYVEANLANPVSLGDLASAAGLTRMHFAAQFRVATGLRPHEYLLRRRVERAQEMLVQDRASIVRVALSTGFQNQSHFTSTFKRFIGQPPNAWRQSLERNRSGS